MDKPIVKSEAPDPDSTSTYSQAGENRYCKLIESKQFPKSEVPDLADADHAIIGPGNMSLHPHYWEIGYGDCFMDAIKPTSPIYDPDWKSRIHQPHVFMLDCTIHFIRSPPSVLGVGRNYSLGLNYTTTIVEYDHANSTFTFKQPNWPRLYRLEMSAVIPRDRLYNHLYNLNFPI